MSFSDMVLRSDERAIYSLRELYKRNGYSHFKVSKFEEYDLYARNKSFLVSENILTFTDTNGKLMALKPDVTLSIVKNISPSDNGTHKYYYNENVYRPSAESHGFKEIVQTGLECIGTVDTFAESEVLMLACKSLENISDDYILDVSHMGFIEGIFECANIEDIFSAKILSLVKSKNVFEIRKICEENSIAVEIREALCTLTELYLPLDKALVLVERFLFNQKMNDAFNELKKISKIMSEYGISENLYFDFSVVNDFNYYDGIVFKGFINGIPDSVLSGGRYDRLLLRMGKRFQAIGFAVYLDRLERFGDDAEEYDADVLVVYDECADAKNIIETVKNLTDRGMTVKTASMYDSNGRYRQVIDMTEGGNEK